MNHSYTYRNLSEWLKHLLAHFPCVIVVGARQVGKSTLLTHLFPEANHILLDNNPIKRISEKPKGYFADTGQVCYSQMISSPDAISAHPLWGALFENAVVSELRKQASKQT